MRSNRIAKLLRSLLAFAFVFSASVVHAQKIVQQIEIHSGWGGLGTPQNENVIIHQKNGVFVRDSKPVDAAIVQALLAALDAPLIPQPDATNLGATPTWLKTNAASQHPKTGSQTFETTPDQRNLFTTSFTNPELVAKTLPNLFNSMRTDDYPSAKLEVVFADGSKLTAQSNSNFVFMLPWTLDGKEGATYNADISRAVSALLPVKAVNKERLTGDDFLTQLVDAVMRSIDEKWKLLGVESRAGDALAALRSAYTVKSADINPYHDVAFGIQWSAKGPHETNLHALLHKESFPANFLEDLVLLYDHDDVQGVGEFLKTGDAYENLALSIPWLNNYMSTNPKENVVLVHVHQTSFGDHAMQSFALDMKARGREDLVPVVRAQQAQIALLKIGFVYWLVFPDKHMMLWRFEGPRGFLKWKQSDFPAGTCGNYKVNDGGCSGREVTPDGILAAEHAPRDQECMNAHKTTEVQSTYELFPVMDHDRAGFINVTGKTIIPLCFDKLGSFSEGLARFERDGKWGYINASGGIVIEPKFPWAGEFSEGRAKVQVTGNSLAYNGRWGFIDKSGNVVVLPNYREMSSGRSNVGSDADDDAFHEGRAVVKADDNEGYIDTAGSVVIPLQFTYADRFSEGLAAAAIESAGEANSWGYIDTTGKWVIHQQFYRASRFSEHLAFVSRAKDCGYIDSSGEYALKPPIPQDEKDCSTVGGDFSEGLATWRVGKKYGFIDHSGRVVIRPQFDAALHFSEGLAAVRIGSNWGYIDKTGKIVIKLKPSDGAEDFVRGLAFVNTKDGRYGYINKSGEYVWTPTFLYNN